MKILGIEPGSHNTGWGIIDKQGSKLNHVASGTLKAGQGKLPERLCAIADGLEEILTRHSPETVAVEKVFHAKNSQSALKLGQARGATLLVLARYGIPIAEYTTTAIKETTTGTGRADKQQVQHVVKMILNLDHEMGPDTSDALAIAICQASYCDMERAIKNSVAS